MTSTAGPVQNRLFYVTDNASGTCFLVDTGSEVSVIPPDPSTSRKTSSPSTTLLLLHMAHNHLHSTWAFSFQWIFIIADVHKPIIGADISDFCWWTWKKPPSHRHMHTVMVSWYSFPRPFTQSNNPPDSSNPYLNILADFPVVTQVCSPNRLIQHDVTHHINTTGHPILLPVPGNLHQSAWRSLRKNLSTCSN